MKWVAHIHRILIPAAVVLASAAVASAASTDPTIQTNQGCYLLNQPVTITGSGFAPSMMYTITLDGVRVPGSDMTDASGAFKTSILPGGLDAGYAQKTHILTADDGINLAQATITVTRPTGALVITGTGPAARVRARFEAWGFDLKNDKPPPVVPGRPAPPVYVHYVNPRGRLIMTIPIGLAHGQCGYVKSAPRPLFGFSPGHGTWTLQFDTNARYRKHPTGPVVKQGLVVR